MLLIETEDCWTCGFLKENSKIGFTGCKNPDIISRAGVIGGSSAINIFKYVNFNGHFEDVANCACKCSHYKAAK